MALLTAEQYKTMNPEQVEEVIQNHFSQKPIKVKTRKELEKEIDAEIAAFNSKMQ